MTVVTRPGDTGELPIGEQKTVDLVGERITRIRLMAPPPAPTDPGGTTRQIKPPTVLVPLVPRRPRVDPTRPIRLIEQPAMPTGAELAVAARGCQPIDPNDEDFTTSPTAPPRPLPTPPPAPPRPTRSIHPGGPGLWTRLTYKGAHRAGAR